MDEQIVTILGGLNWDSLLNWEGFNFRFVACSAKFALMDVVAFWCTEELNRDLEKNGNSNSQDVG